MRQEQIAGIILGIIGLVLTLKPTLAWAVTEKRKAKGGKAPSAVYLRVLRIAGGAFLGVGVLLLIGVLK